MAIAITLKQYLSDNDIDYEALTHPYTASSLMTAEESHIPGSRIAKGVVLKKGKDYLLAVLPASNHIHFEEIRNLLDQRVKLASEEEVESLFEDCEIGAVPPIGRAYGLEVLIDDSLSGNEDIYFEAGDHATLIHVAGKQFGEMMGSARHGRFSYPG
ncbi:MAG: YbaK/EbsC family protein [Rhodospirillales bacterium]|nr:YbaK/EbsC family protein [Alphaproteobacteria bacterium]MBL6947551.1 YbaK/EbsC family protein [Rhodospirillales bacterium]